MTARFHVGSNRYFPDIEREASSMTQRGIRSYPEQKVLVFPKNSGINPDKVMEHLGKKYDVPITPIQIPIGKRVNV